MIVNLLKCETARLLTEAGVRRKSSPPRVMSAKSDQRRLFEETYDDYRRRIGVLYR